MEKLEANSNLNFFQEKIKILIAEDNELNMRLTKQLVNKVLPNSLLYEAYNGEEAIKRMIELAPDLILMDVQMPIMDGLQATHFIREEIKDDQIPIIAVTSCNNEGDKEKCLEAGMNGFINKPVSEGILREALMKWLSNKGKDIKVHVDFDIIHIYTLEDKEFEKVFISLLIKSINEALQDFHSHIIQKDLVAIKASAHKLRGAAATSGLNKITLITSKIEALKDFEEDIIKNLMEQLEDEAEIVDKILSNYLTEG